MKAIILCGGSGSRLAPLTIASNKQLLPVYDKPVIYYPLSTALLAGITEIVIISTPHDLPKIEQLLGDGSSFGVSLQYVVQDQPRGIPEAFTLAKRKAKNFVKQDDVMLLLGDNLFFGNDLTRRLVFASNRLSSNGGAEIFCYHVPDPERFGVAELNRKDQVISIEEKPKFPASNYAITGLYMFDNNVYEIAESLKPSGRGELEIVDVMKAYMEAGTLRANTLRKGFFWKDVGTADALYQASTYVKTIQDSQGVKLSCPEEIAYRQGFIDDIDLQRLIERHKNSEYGTYLKQVLAEGPPLVCS
jgi:glucose-1-phosphate thymidylyltransferase